MAVLPISTVPFCTGSRNLQARDDLARCERLYLEAIVGDVGDALCEVLASPHSVSSDLGQLAACRHLISGDDCGPPWTRTRGRACPSLRRLVGAQPNVVTLPAKQRGSQTGGDLGMKIGAYYFPTDYGIDIAELARALEQRGFESLFVCEHTHIPVSRRTP